MIGKSQYLEYFDDSLSPHVLEIKFTSEVVHVGIATCFRIEAQLDDPLRVWESILEYEPPDLHLYGHRVNCGMLRHEVGVTALAGRLLFTDRVRHVGHPALKNSHLCCY